MWHLLETVMALVINHHLDAAQASQFEEFYDKNLRGSSKLFFSKMEETTIAGKTLDMVDRLANLRDGYCVVYRTREAELVLDWWVGRSALYLSISAPSNMTEISIFRHSELGGDRLHMVRMDMAVAQAQALQKVFGDEVLLIARSECPYEGVMQQVAEGLNVQEILKHFADEHPAPQHIVAEALRDVEEDELQSWYLVEREAGA